MRVIAWRGAHPHPENSLAAVEAAAAQGAWLSEVDVRLSRDSVPVLVHSPRVWPSGPLTHERSARWLKRHGVTLLEEVLAYPLLVHLKREAEPRRLALALARLGYAGLAHSNSWLHLQLLEERQRLRSVYAPLERVEPGLAGYMLGHRAGWGVSALGWAATVAAAGLHAVVFAGNTADWLSEVQAQPGVTALLTRRLDRAGLS